VVNSAAGALEQSFKAGVKNAYITPNIPWLIMALRKQAEQSPSKQTDLLRQALRVARKNGFCYFSFGATNHTSCANWDMSQLCLEKLHEPENISAVV